MKTGKLTEEEQKEFDYLEGLKNRKGVTFPYQVARYRELLNKLNQKK